MDAISWLYASIGLLSGFIVSLGVWTGVRRKPCWWLRRWFRGRRKEGDDQSPTDVHATCPATYNSDNSVSNLEHCILTLFRGKPRWEPRGWDFIEYVDPRDNAPEPYHSTEEHYQTMVHFARTQELFHFPNTSYYDLPRRPLALGPRLVERAGRSMAFDRGTKAFRGLLHDRQRVAAGEEWSVGVEGIFHNRALLLLPDTF